MPLGTNIVKKLNKSISDGKADKKLKKGTVLMADLAFLVPLKKVRHELRRCITMPLVKELPFVKKLNADFKIYPIGLNSLLPNATATKFFFVSQSKEKKPISLYAYIMQYSIGQHDIPHYALLLTISIDKYLITDVCNNDNLCSLNDLVLIKKAVYEGGLYKSPECQQPVFANWLEALVCRISGMSANSSISIEIAGSVADIIVQEIENAKTYNKSDLDQQFCAQYFDDATTTSIDTAFSNQCLPNNPNDSSAPVSDIARLVHGMLYANNNHKLLNNKVVIENVGDFYSNNRVEKYWAVPDNIVSIKVASPFEHVSENDRHIGLANDAPGNINCLMELSVLIMLKRRMRSLLSNHLRMKSYEVELQRSSISSCFNESIYNLQELDNRMNFFMRRFNLHQKYDEIQKVILPRVSYLDKLFNHKTVIISIIIAFASLLIALLK